MCLSSYVDRGTVLLRATLEVVVRKVEVCCSWKVDSCCGTGPRTSDGYNGSGLRGESLVLVSVPDI